MSHVATELPTECRLPDSEILAWLVFTPNGHKFDYLLFGERADAEDCANDFAEGDDEQTWNIYPLRAGDPIEIGN